MQRVDKCTKVHAGETVHTCLPEDFRWQSLSGSVPEICIKSRAISKNRNEDYVKETCLGSSSKLTNPVERKNIYKVLIYAFV